MSIRQSSFTALPPDSAPILESMDRQYRRWIGHALHLKALPPAGVAAVLDGIVTDLRTRPRSLVAAVRPRMRQETDEAA